MKKRIPELVLIFARDKNNVIGKDNTLPWRSPHDLQWFQKQTLGHSVIMGRKTWESLPPRWRPLAQRTNYVITRNRQYVAPGAIVQPSLPSAIGLCWLKNKSGVIFVIGGKSLLEEAAKSASRALVSMIDVKTPIDDTCVMAPRLPPYDVDEVIPLFAGNDDHPAVDVGVLYFK